MFLIFCFLKKIIDATKIIAIEINSNNIQSVPLNVKFFVLNGTRTGNLLVPPKKISNEMCENTAQIEIAPNLKSFLPKINIIITIARIPNVME